MAVNRNKPDRWKADIAQSVDMYNDWFIHFAPEAYRSTRVKTTSDVETTLRETRYLSGVEPALLKAKPAVLPTLRMSTCPPLAVDRLIGLARVPPNLIRSMEKNSRLPPRMPEEELEIALERITSIILSMADPDIFVWLKRNNNPSQRELYRAATIVADRLTGAVANPVIRNAQEMRQLDAIAKWLENREYLRIQSGEGATHEDLAPGTFAFRMNVPAEQEDTDTKVNIPVDAVVMPKTSKPNDLPFFIEAKSAGDFTNVNKRRKEEAVKVSQLRRTYGQDVRYILFLCGYFDSGYLGYEAAEGIDWVWEHRIEDLGEFGL